MLRRTLLTALVLSAIAVSPASAQQLVAHPGVAVVPAQPVTAPHSIAAAPMPLPPGGVTATATFYTPSYYYYYYQPPYHVQYVQPAVVAPVIPLGPAMSDFGVTPVTGVGLANSRGEPGHVRYPYHSYRRPWYFPGQPSFNVTIPGQVW